MADSRQIILHNLADLADRFLSKEIQIGRLQNKYSFGLNRVHIFSLKTHVFILMLNFLAKKNFMWRCFLWPLHLTNSSGGPVEAKASGDLIADMKEGILFINVIIIFPMKSKKKTCKSKNDVKLQKNMWGGQGVGWSHLRGPCRRKKPLPLARVEVVSYPDRCSP